MLLGSAILEVVIGVVFVYILFSVICSALNEWMAGILKLRSSTLRVGIQNLLNDPAGEHLAKQFFNHPLFKGLTLGQSQSFPSYVPARTFARILIDIVTPAGAEHRDLTETYKRIRDVVANLSSANDELGKALLILIDEAGVNPQRIENTAKALQQLEKTRLDLLDFVHGAGNEIAQIEFAASTLEKIGELEASFKRAEEGATAALHQAQQNVETYFNEAMERLSGWYKRRVQVFILAFALGISVLLNVDTIAIAGSLATMPALRAAVVTAAENLEAVPQPSADSLGTINALLGQVDALGIPIGWRSAPGDLLGWILKVLGLLISTAAIAQGAPFWFDLLGKLINVRMAGKKPSTPGDKTNEPQA
ncbi:MAG: hypothetical protein DCC55_03125 [Chloroflexi bacterium]|nr:MAG: hypothetical protein DCC55_03125 [Chloroflexota bacterium]